MTNWQHYGKIERPQKDKQQYIKHKFKTELHELDVNRCKNISRSGSTCGTIRVAYASTNSVIEKSHSIGDVMFRGKMTEVNISRHL